MTNDGNNEGEGTGMGTGTGMREGHEERKLTALDMEINPYLDDIGLPRQSEAAGGHGLYIIILRSLI
jgi:hypothetical protein